MSSPGWYPDPAGVPGRFRHWDGSSWSAQTTHDPMSPPPVGPPAPTMPPAAPKGPKWPWVVGGIAVVTVLAVLLVAVWRMTADDTPTPTPEPTPSATDPTVPPDPGPETTGPAPATCTAGMGSVDSTASSYEAAGLSYTAVPDWGFRYDRYQWLWIDDVAAWGKLDTDSDFASGIVFGELRHDNGFVDLVDSLDSSFECLQNYGPWDRYEFEWTTNVIETTVDDLPAIEVRATVTPGPDDTYPGYDLRNIVIATDDPHAFALWVSFVPTGDTEAALAVEEAYASLRRV